jgi:topoisomerase IV subunit A
VAISNLIVVYNRKTGFLGHHIKEEDPTAEIAVACSEYDKLFLLFTDGLYKIIPIVEKLYVGPELAWFGVVEKDIIFNVIYRDGAENLAYVKRFSTPSFILEKEYRLFPEHKRSKILHLDFGENKFVKIYLVPSARAKTNSMEIAFSEFLLKNPAAKGKRLSSRTVRKIVSSSGSGLELAKQNLPLPGLESPGKEEMGGHDELVPDGGEE